MCWASLFFTPIWADWSWRTEGQHPPESWKWYWCSQDQRLIPSHSNQYYNSGMFTKLQRHSYSEFHILCRAVVSRLMGLLKPWQPCRTLLSAELPRWKLQFGCWTNTGYQYLETHHAATSPAVPTALIEGDPCSQLEHKSSGSRAEGSGWRAHRVARWSPTAALVHTVVSEHSSNVSCVLLGITALLLLPLIASTPKHGYGHGECLKNPDAVLSLNAFSFPQNTTALFLQRQPRLRHLSRKGEEAFVWCVLVLFNWTPKPWGEHLALSTCFNGNYFNVLHGTQQPLAIKKAAFLNSQATKEY